jgi:hypothetical protein
MYFIASCPVYQAENKKALSDRQGSFAVVPGKLYLDKNKYWRCGERLERAQLDRLDTDGLALLRAFRPKIYGTGDLGEQGMILAHANVFSCMYPGTALPDNNASSGDQFPTVAFHAQAFGI